MRRFLVSAVACLLAGCADRPATAIVAAVAADHDTLGAVKSIRLRAYRGTELRHELILPPQTLDHPGTLTYRDDTDGDSRDTLRFVIDGLASPPPPTGSQPSYGSPGQGAPGLTPQAGTRVDDADPDVLVRRSARLPFVKEKTKVLRLGLSASCLGVPCDQATETCKAGRCVDDTEDPNALPDASGDLGGIDYGSFTDLPDGTAGAGGGPGLVCNVSSSSELYVDAKAPGGCSDDARCGSKDHPNCTLGAAIQNAKARLAQYQQDVTIRLAATQGDEAYAEAFVLPAGVNLFGGYNASWSEPPVGTTRLRPPTRTSFVEDGVAAPTGMHVRSTVSVGAASGNLASTSLRNLVIEMPSSAVVTPEQAADDAAPYLTAGIHLHGSLSASLTSVTVSGGPGSPSLIERTEGVYVSGGGSGKVQIATSTLAPPASQRGHSSALTLERDVQTNLSVCLSTLVGGDALSEGRTSAGLRALGGSSVSVQAGCASATDASARYISGGVASTSHGILLDAPTSLSIQPGMDVNGVRVAPPGKAEWPVKVTAVAAVEFNPLHTTDVTISGATLIGLAGDQNVAAPGGARFYGLRASADGAPTGLAPGFSVQLSGATLRGAVGLEGTACEAAHGLSLLGPAVLTASSTVPAVKIYGGQLVGGDGCDRRVGAEVANLDVVTGTTGDAVLPVFTGSEAKGDTCASATGLSVDSKLTGGTSVSSGTYLGGDSCQERTGLRVAGVSGVENVVARGVAEGGDTGGSRLVGLEVAGGVEQGTTKVSMSTLTGGTMYAPAALPGDRLVYAAGLRLALDGGANITNNKDISGCAPLCQGAMFAAGVRVDRPGKGPVSTIVIENNKNITGAQFTSIGTLSKEARVDGILVQGFVGLDGTNQVLSGGAFGQNLNVRVGSTDGSIRGTPLTSSGGLLPGATTGVTIHGSGVTVQGTALQPLTIAAGDAIDRAVGVRICDEDAYTSTATCQDGTTTVQYARVTGGAARQSAGVSAQRVYGLVLDGLTASPGGSVASQEKSRGVWLRDRNTGIVADSYFFGLSPSPSAGDVEDRACALELDGVGKPPATASLLFVHNACVAGGAGVGVSRSIALYVDETQVVTTNMPLTIANNLLAVGDGTTNPVGWFRSRTSSVSPTQTGKLTLTANALFSSANGVPVGLTVAGFPQSAACPTNMTTGHQLCDKSQANTYFQYELGAPQSATNNEFAGAPPGQPPYDGIYDPATWMMGGQCGGLVGEAPLVMTTGDTSTSPLATDFLGQERTSATGAVFRGPLVCTYAGG